MLRDALLLQLGYNATLVTLGAAVLGAGAGLAGVFLVLRRRALVSDALAHATLPGVALAFVAGVALGGDGRSLPALMLGAAGSALVGLWAVQALSRHTRLPEDAAIGAVLSSFFGLGVVLMTVIQTLPGAQAAGLEDVLLGATAGMLRAEAWLIAAAAAVTLALVVLARRPMTLVAFDPVYAEVRGTPPARVDFAIMALTLAITVIGLKIVGLVLIVALLIIPPVTARLWTDRVDRMLPAAAGAGAVAGYIGAAISASAADLPAGPVIVLTAAALFAGSLLVAPRRGALAAALGHRALQHRVHRRQGLLALAAGQTVRDPLTLRLLRRDGMLRADGTATDRGRAAAAHAARDAARWRAAAARADFATLAARHDGISDIDRVLTPDQIATLDGAARPRAVG